MVRVLSLLLSARWSTPIGATPMEASLSGSLSDWAVALMDTLGGPGAGLAIALENLFPPLPSEVILPLAGFAAARGSLSLVEALVWTTTGSVVGALLLYLIGATLGQHGSERSRPGCRWSGPPPSTVRRPGSTGTGARRCSSAG